VRRNDRERTSKAIRQSSGVNDYGMKLAVYDDETSLPEAETVVK
jgi:hypothetical protein